MTWKPRQPSSFPARYRRAMVEAVASPGSFVLLMSGEASVVAADAEEFRYYRWCIRQNPLSDSILTDYLQRFQFRISTEKSGHSRAMYVSANVAKAVDLAALNPHLLELIEEIG
jgi:hypothetical protein